jgi:hypothetical protein
LESQNFGRPSGISPLAVQSWLPEAQSGKFFSATGRGGRYVEKALVSHRVEARGLLRSLPSFRGKQA